MSEAEAIIGRHDLEAKIVKRCREDEGFRKEFIGDPSGAFVKYLKVPATDLPKIVIHQEQPGSWHIVLPAKPANANELSERELESVAGGASAAQGSRSFMVLTQVAALVSMTVSGAASLKGSEGW